MAGTNDDLLKQAIATLSIADVWQKLGAPGEPPRVDATVRSPLRDDDKDKSFSIFDNGRKFKDHGTGLKGDSYNFFQAYKKIDSKQAFVPFVELAGLGHLLNAKNPPPFDWSALEKLNLGYQDRLAKWRGFSPKFVKWLVEKDLIRLLQCNGTNQWAFPVVKGEKICGCHYRAVNCAESEKAKWGYKPRKKDGGPGVQPFVIGNLKDALVVHIFESTWDGLTFVDVSEAYHANDVAAIVTRGATEFRTLRGIIPEEKPIYAWPQNDHPNGSGKIASEEWVNGVRQAIGVRFLRVSTPSEFSDLNDWTRAGATKADLIAATKSGEPIEPLTQPSRLDGPLDGLDIYYDSYKTTFWVQNDRGGWIRVTTEDVKRRLAQQGYRTTRAGDGLISQVDELLIAVQRSNDVDYADSLAGFQAGIHIINTHRVLVRDSPKLIKPNPGEWPTLQEIILNMLGEDQQRYLFGWLKVAIEALHVGKLRVGQALTIAGPRDCGKSLLQILITDILGGRSHKPHRYMSGLTPFNSELFGAEHLMIEDEEASTDIRARRNFGSKVKAICANLTQSCHPKNRTALHLTPFWRISITLNDEAENLMVLPPIDEDLQDKFIILKASKHPMPMPTVTDMERETFMNVLRSELPAFIDFLLKWQIPEALVSQRYGITHFHHPDILQALGVFSPESRLLEMIDAELFSSPAPGSWEGTASELERKLTADGSKVKREASKLLTFQAACGTYLGRLRNIDRDRFKDRHTNKGTRWTIHPPKD
jgi:hypothetical protein